MFSASGILSKKSDYHNDTWAIKKKTEVMPQIFLFIEKNWRRDFFEHDFISAVKILYLKNSRLRHQDREVMS
jgi:hypothetical protein